MDKGTKRQSNKNKSRYQTYNSFFGHIELDRVQIQKKSKKVGLVFCCLFSGNKILQFFWKIDSMVSLIDGGM